MNENRIQINGEWYIKESSLTPTLEVVDYLGEVTNDIIEYNGLVFENDAICIEAEFSKDFLYDIKVLEKKSDKKIEEDNLDFFLNFIKNPSHDSEFNNTFDDSQLRYISAFMLYFKNNYPTIK